MHSSDGNRIPVNLFSGQCPNSSNDHISYGPTSKSDHSIPAMGIQLAVVLMEYLDVLGFGMEEKGGNEKEKCNAFHGFEVNPSFL